MNLGPGAVPQVHPDEGTGGDRSTVRAHRDTEQDASRWKVTWARRVSGRSTLNRPLGTRPSTGPADELSSGPTASPYTYSPWMGCPTGVQELVSHT